MLPPPPPPSAKELRGLGVQDPRLRIASTPIDRRRTSTLTTAPQMLAFAVVFNSSILLINSVLFFALPLRALPWTAPVYEATVPYAKQCFARLIVAISQWFAPTHLVLSVEDEEGKRVDPETIVSRNARGDVVEVRLPPRSIWMSNHQVYTDWLYLWNLAYYADLADSILIILKDSLKWVPFVGWGMQFFRFIFLRRSWAADRQRLADHLSFVAERSRATPSKLLTYQRRDRHEVANATTAATTTTTGTTTTSLSSKLLLLIFPEGTLVSPQTRPVSRRYAEKVGIQDLSHALLPRSTGLHFCLRSLGAEMPDLKLVDIDMAYEGIPAGAYGQSYYTLRSIFMQGVPPPSIHLNLRVLPLSSLPLGANRPKSASQAATAEGESTDAEKREFDEWLVGAWRRKDERLERFYRDGDFVGGEYQRDVARGGAAGAMDATAGETKREAGAPGSAGAAGQDEEGMDDDWESLAIQGDDDDEGRGKGDRSDAPELRQRRKAEPSAAELGARQGAGGVGVGSALRRGRAPRAYVTVPIRLRNSWLEAGSLFGYGLPLLGVYGLARLGHWLWSAAHVDEAARNAWGAAVAAAAEATTAKARA